VLPPLVLYGGAALLLAAMALALAAPLAQNPPIR
jgi:hypothetical protein